MKIVFYTTSSTFTEDRCAFYLPTKADLWDELAERYPEHEIIVVFQEPSYFLIDRNKNGTIMQPKLARYVLIEETASTEEISQKIVALKPDVAIAISISSVPLDWNGLKDSAIAEILQSYGIKTIATPVETSMIFFDKWRTHQELRCRGYNVAKAMYVHNGLFFAERNQANIRNNVYRDCQLLQIQKLRYPVIIKPTTGSASFRTEIAQNFEVAKGKLCSKKNKGDVIVEEFIQGEQFGLEIHRVKDEYVCSPLFKLSVNSDGVVDPMKNIKFGPITDEKYECSQLQNVLIQLAKELEFPVITQVDVIFKDNSWYIIEINPRWSGMTETIAASQGRNSFSILLNSVVCSKIDYSNTVNFKNVVSFKIPELNEDILKSLYAKPFVKVISDFPLGKSAYREIIIGGQSTKEELITDIQELSREFPHVIDSDIITKVKNL